MSRDGELETKDERMREGEVGVASRNDENRKEPDFRLKLVAALALRVHPKSIFFFPQALVFQSEHVCIHLDRT